MNTSHEQSLRLHKRFLATKKTKKTNRQRPGEIMPRRQGETCLRVPFLSLGFPYTIHTSAERATRAERSEQMSSFRMNQAGPCTPEGLIN